MQHSDDVRTAPGFMKTMLLFAGAYNILFGLWAIFFPMMAFELAGFEKLPLYPSLWQCIGMIVGVYGVGYAIAAFDPYRHWPIVLVGLLGKIFGPIGMVWTVARGELPIALGVVCIFNDLIWWVPFSMVLWGAFRANQLTAAQVAPLPEDALNKLTDQDGQTVTAVLSDGKTLLVFLRHCGCTFAREMLDDVADVKSELQTHGIRLAVVHQTAEPAASELFKRYDLDDVTRFYDPDLIIYRSFGLEQGRFGQLFGLKTWWRGFFSAIVNRHGFGALDGNGFQMPGVFLIDNGDVVHSYRHQTASDRPDYLKIALGVNTQEPSAAIGTVPD